MIAPDRERKFVGHPRSRVLFSKRDLRHSETGRATALGNGSAILFVVFALPSPHGLFGVKFLDTSLKTSLWSKPVDGPGAPHATVSLHFVWLQPAGNGEGEDLVEG